MTSALMIAQESAQAGRAFPLTIQQEQALAARARLPQSSSPSLSLATSPMLAAGVRVRGTFDAPAVRQALSDVSARHAALRVQFETASDASAMSWARHVQVILEPTDVELRHNDLSRLTTPAQCLEFIRLSQQHRAWTADASRTLFRASCFRFNDAEHILILFVDPIGIWSRWFDPMGGAR